MFANLYHQYGLFGFPYTSIYEFCVGGGWSDSVYSMRQHVPELFYQRFFDEWYLYPGRIPKNYVPAETEK